jgi:hypothetical protein
MNKPTEGDDVPDDNPRPLRDKSGRFLPGHVNITPGRPKKATEAAYHAATMTACSPDQWADIVKAAVCDCYSEKVSERSAARTFLLKALFGERPGALVQIANVVKSDPLETALHFIDALAAFVRTRAPEHAPAVAELLEPFGKALVDAGGDPRALVELSDLPPGKLPPERLARLQQAIREIYGVELPAPAPAKARGLSEADARFWREQVLMGEGSGDGPAPRDDDEPDTSEG